MSEAPHSAIKDESAEQHKEEYHFTMIEIQIGNSELGFTEVILPTDFPGETTKIVVKNAYAILSKMKNSEVEE